MTITIPNTRPERWQWLREQIAEWYSPLQPEDGWSEAILQEAEKRLGVKLPAALREWYQLGANRQEIWSPQDRFLQPNELGGSTNGDSENGEEFLIVYDENQSVVQWGIRVTDLSLEDPPVYLVDWRPDDSGGPTCEASSVSEFALAMFCYQLCIAGPNSCFSATAYPDQQAFSMISRLPALFPQWHWPADTSIRAYETTAVICISQDRHREIHMASKDQGLLTTFANSMGLKWDSVYRNGVEIE